MNLLISKIIDYIGEKLNILILSPSYRSFGDSVEQIFFALLHCQEKGKKLILLTPFNKIFGKKVSISNFHLFNLEHEIIIKPSPFIDFLLKTFVSFLDGLSFINIEFRKKIGKVLNLDQSFYSGKEISFKASQQFGKNYLYDHLEKNFKSSSEWKEIELKYKSPSLPMHLKEKAVDFLENNCQDSINKKWIVLHVLDNLNNDYARGANIENYYSAIEYLIQKGFHVFRIGDSSMPKCREIAGLTDLTRITHQNYIDLYLISKSFLFIGTQSGPAYATNLFKKNLLLTNTSDWSTSLPRKYGNFFIPKTFIRKKNDTEISLFDLFKEDFNFQVNTNSLSNRDFYLKENTSQEILDAVKDYFIFKKDKTEYSIEQKNYNRKKYEWLKKTLINNNNLQINYAPKKQKGLIRSRSIAESETSGTIARSFINKHTH